ncbi:PBP1A family penicillin-binding protein [Brevibacillus fluminis]|uniref:PBP1A family penicillin-binding protein n=1 Tax=Brevibacillus fluminis TaxID=511487 RepID=A0A3M8DHA5_9BACL|nr:PBP1A family penicillin-binding protein [Brevibacillus fluminis]RNB87388.1 PBP1A family penicillin-binding protein [Brevibacillus fluminis]
MAANKTKRKKKSKLPLLVISFFVFLLLSIFGGYFALLYAGQQLIDPQKLEDIKTEASVIYDKNGKQVGTLAVQETRDYVPISKMPPNLINAFVSVEDRRFFEHNGVDLFRVGGAILKDVQQGSMAEGGSTITQQLAKNVFLSHEKTFWRKTKEMSIAISLERKYSKDEIMEMYLNKIYLGHGVYGVEAASQLYFNKHVEDLDNAEVAMLAAIPKAPSTYSPFAKPALAKERRDTILRLMSEQGYITAEQKQQAQAEPLPTRKNPTEAGIKPGYEAYVDYVVQEAEDKYGVPEEMLYRGGWDIYTALDTKVQDAMIKQFKNSDNFPADGPKQQVEGAMVVLDQHTGGIAGLMGGRSYVHKGFSHATDMRRQPGSTFKPLAVYAPAIDMGKANLYSQLNNMRQNFNGYEPRNYNNQYSKTISIQDAVAQSINVPAVSLLNDVGISNSLDYLKKFGIQLDPQNDRNLAIALGGLSKGTSPLEMAQAYSAFADGGKMSKGYVITKISNDKMGFEKSVAPEQSQVISAQTAWDMHQLLAGVVQYGTGKNARIKGFDVVGKTGTTQSTLVNGADKDAWFVGYTPEYLGAVWMGFDTEDKSHVMRKESGIPAKMFSKVMSEALEGVKSKGFTRPDGAKDEQPPEQEVAGPQLAADLTIDGDKLKVVLSWIGNEGSDVTYDIYRFADSIDKKELIAADVKDTSYVDTLTQPTMYSYLVVRRDAQGVEGPPSNVAKIDTAKLDKLLEDAKQHDDQNQGDGQGDQQPPLDNQGQQTGDPNQPSDGSQTGQPGMDNQGQPIPPTGGDTQPPADFQQPPNETPDSSTQQEQSTDQQPPEKEKGKKKHKNNDN